MIRCDQPRTPIGAPVQQHQLARRPRRRERRVDVTSVPQNLVMRDPGDGLPRRLGQCMQPSGSRWDAG